MIDYPATQTDAHHVLVGLIIRIVQSPSRAIIESGEEWRNDAQVLAVKLLRHIVSMQNLSLGTTVNFPSEEPLHYIDHSSIIVIARAALETYLVWHYLYGEPPTEKTRFRYLAWRLGGLVERQKLIPTTQKGRDVMARELRQVQSLCKEIEQFPEFQVLKEGPQRRLLDGDWKIILGTSDLAAAAGFHTFYFSNVYDYLCGYSDASYISAFQISEAASLQDQTLLTHSIMSIGVVTMAHFVRSYSRQFPKAQQILDADEVGKLTVDRWALMAENMAPLSDRPSKG